MNNNLTEIVCVLDRSGSMASLTNDAIGGFNSFLDEQKKLPGDARLSLILFDHEYIVQADNAPIQQVEPLTAQTYVPRGSTALLDAIGRAITNVGERLTKTSERDRPSKVIVVILTDGEENASHEYTKQRIADMIKHQQEQYNWRFVYLGVAVDAFADARAFNIPANYVTSAGIVNNVGTASHTSWGVTEIYSRASSAVTTLRSAD